MFAYCPCSVSSAAHLFQEVPTDVEIDRDTLMRRDPINFFTKLVLYEDELADNGVSEVSTFF